MKPKQVHLAATAFASSQRHAIALPPRSSFITAPPCPPTSDTTFSLRGSHQSYCGSGSMPPLCASAQNSPTMRESSTSSPPPLRGVVLDMDGTLTMPTIDFAKMYEDCNVPRGCDILAELERMSPAEGDRCRQIIGQMEEEARRSMVLMPGAVELGRWLHLHGVPFALVTRNTARTVDTLVGAWTEGGGPPFDAVLSRDECSGLPPKPHPASLIQIASKWDIDLTTEDPKGSEGGEGNSVVMVGDSLRHDVAFGKAAGVSTALLDISSSSSSSHITTCSSSSTGEEQPEFHINGLWELASLLCRHRIIPGSLGTGHPLKYYGLPPGPSSIACLAAHSGAVTMLKTLPPEDLIAPEEEGSDNTPLIWAADQGKIEAVRFLLTVPNVDVNYRGYLGSTAICRAARRGHADIVRLLAKDGEANMEIPNIKMQYPLHFAAFKLMDEAVDALLECGASTLALDRKGRTPAEDTSSERIRERILAARRNTLGSSFRSTTY